VPGATGLGIPYPLEAEVVDANSVQNLANSVDALLNTAFTAANLSRSRPAALAVRDTTTQSFTSGVALANVTYTTEHYDNDAMCNLGVNNERLTVVTAGVYCVYFAWAVPSSNSSQFTSSNTVITVNGAIVSGRKLRWGEDGAIVCMRRLAAADILRAQYTWTGTGTNPKLMTRAALGARWICSL
jgi:hypothetical protein